MSTTFDHDTTYDLAALIIRIRAPRPMHVYNHMGRAVFQLGLMLLNACDPSLAVDVHDEGSEKPFTASGLMRGDVVHFGDLETDDLCWVRFTALSAATVTALEVYYRSVSAELAQGGPVQVEINHMLWPVEAIEWDGSRLPGRCSYQQLIDRNREGEPAWSHTLTFLSATTFRSSGLVLPLPRPDLVFGSLLNRWVAFTSHRLRDLPDDQVMVFLTHHILISGYRTETAPYKGKQGSIEVGFIGEVTFELLRANDHLKKREPALEATLRREYVWFARTVNLLIDFAYYSGIGRKTTNGMGMAWA
ncbi:MAG: CRISPR system precrRNA processing endoribonuclease RAMP protein Cas6 [Chloroflexi bacterium]|nr:CRISPR system precrRNA processing endoribonuclease RAMP protein Cas6 [Chloroflexota bacterium]